MNHYHKIEADDTIKADMEFHKLRTEFEAKIIALRDRQPEHSEVRQTIQDYMDYVDDAYAETLEIAATEAEKVQDELDDMGAY